VLYSVASYLYHPSRGYPAAFVMWSDVASGNGWEFFNKLVEKFPNSFVANTRGVENPRTSNTIYVWIWEIPHEALKKWYLEEKVSRIKRG
jgi:hypothetical protein